MEFETFHCLFSNLASILCKFTPMEFETTSSIPIRAKQASVNLLRWSLKQVGFDEIELLQYTCKFTPLEFETRLSVGHKPLYPV